MIVILGTMDTSRLTQFCEGYKNVSLFLSFLSNAHIVNTR